MSEHNRRVTCAEGRVMDKIHISIVLYYSIAFFERIVVPWAPKN
jgi:hypothetical protein